MRAAARRRLAAAGAVYPVNAVAGLPESPITERPFRRLRSLVGEAGGSAQVLRAETIEGEPELEDKDALKGLSLRLETIQARDWLGAASFRHAT